MTARVKYYLVMFTCDATVCRKGLFEQAPAQRAVRDRVKFPEVVEKNIETLVAFGFFLIFIAI